MTPIEPEHYADLIGAPFRLGGDDPDTGLDCWGAVRIVHSRRGLVVGSPGETGGNSPLGWRRVAEPLPGDVAAYQRNAEEGIDHVGVLLPDGRILHALEDRPACALHRSFLRESLVGWFRADPEVDPLLDPGQIAGAADSGRIVLVLMDNPLEPRLLSRSVVEADGRPVAALVPDSWSEFDYVATIGAQRVENPDTEIPSAGDVVALCRTPKGVAIAAAITTSVILQAVIAFAINAAIAIGLSYLTSLLTAPSLRSRDELGGDDASPTFSQTDIRNTYGTGATIPIVFGEHRVGGHLIGSFNAVSPLSLSALATDTQFGGDSLVQLGAGEQAVGGKTTLNLLFAVSEGEVGVINGQQSDIDLVPSSVLPSGSLLINSNDASVYEGVAMSVRLGTVDQLIIPGFEETTNAVGVEAVIRKNEVFTYTTSTAVDAFEIQLFYPSGLYQVTSSGNISWKRVEYQFAYKEIGAATWIENVTIRRQYVRRGAHSWSIRRENLPEGVYLIRLERLTDNDDDLGTDPGEFSVTQVNAVNEIQARGQSHPGIALVAVRALGTDQLTSLPTITSFINNGKKLWVWDGVSETNPKFDFVWNRNPAWIALNIMLNKVWGLGDKISLDDIDLDSFKDWADYCDEFVADGRGGAMTRWTFDFPYDTAQKAGFVLDLVLTAGRARLIPLGAKIGVSVHKERTPTHLFTASNLKNLQVNYIESDSRPSRFNVDFLSAELDYDNDTASVEVTAPVGSEYVEETIQVRGITHPPRAYRMAQYRQNVSELVDKVITFEGSPDALILQPGDVFWLSSDGLSTTNYSGRCAQDSASAAELYVDQDLTIPAGVIKIRLMRPDGSGFALEEGTVTSTGAVSAGDPISVTGLTTTPLEGWVWALGPQSTYLEAFEVLSCPVDRDLVRKVEAITYDAAIFDDFPGTVPTATDVLYNRRAMPVAVTGLALIEETEVVSGGAIRHTLVASWQADYEFEGAAVYMRIIGDGNQTWDLVGIGSGTDFRIGAFAVGELVEVSVCPTSPDGSRCAPAQGTKASAYIRGKIQAPATPTGLSVHEVEGSLVIDYVEPDEADIDGVEIRVGTYWAGSSHLAWVPAGACRVVIPSPLIRDTEFTLHVKAQNSSGIWSLESASTTFTHRGNERERKTTSESGTWSGTATGLTADGNDLVSSAGQTTVSYETAELTASAAGYYSIAVLPEIEIEFRSTLTWETAHFTWGSAAARAITWEGKPLRDLPDSYRDAVTATWGGAADSWDGPLMAGRTWGGVDRDSFFRVTVETKAAATSGAAYAAAVFEEHKPRAQTIESYGAKITVTVPHADYLVRFKDVKTGLYERKGASSLDTSLSSPSHLEIVYYDSSDGVWKNSPIEGDDSLFFTAGVGLRLKKKSGTSVDAAVSLDGSGVYVAAATGSTAGAMTSADFTKLGTVEADADVTEGYLTTSVLTTTGDILYRSGAGLRRLGIGSSDQVMGVSGGLPAWIEADTLPRPGVTIDGWRQAAFAASATQVLTAAGSTDFFGFRELIPNGHVLKVIGCIGRGRTGSSTGSDYDFEFGLGVMASTSTGTISRTSLATVSESATTVWVSASAVGSYDSPIATIDASAGDRWVVPYFYFTGPGSTDNAKHSCRVWGVIEPA